MKNKSVLQRILTGLFAVLVLAASNSIVRAQDCPGTTHWTGGNGDWFDGANWYLGCVPTVSSDASINNGGQAQIYGGPNHATAHSLILGNSQGESGSLVIAHDNSAVLDLADGCRGVITIGYRGSGSLTIADGGYIRSRYGYVAALQNPTRPNSSGNVTVKGNGTTWFLYDLYDEPECLGAVLYIGSTADSNSGGTATVTVSDGAFISVHNHDPNALYATKVGASGTLTGNGTLEMVDSGTGSIKATVLGTLAPGKPQLTIDGNLDLLSSSTTICHVNPQATPQNDQVLVSNLSGGGTMTLGGTLTVVGSGTFTGGMSFILLQTEGLRVGTFDHFHFYSLSPIGNCLHPTLQYTDQAVNLLIENTCLSSEGAYDG